MQDEIKVKILHDEKALHEAFHLRYQAACQRLLLVEETCIDHKHQMVKDPIDQYAYILGAYHVDKLIATLRGVSYLRCPKQQSIFLEDYYHIFDYKDASRNNACEFGRMYVMKEYESYGVSMRMIQKFFEIAQGNKNIKYVFLEVQEHLVPYYQFFKFKALDPVYNKKYDVTMVPMVLELKDLLKYQDTA